MRNSLLKSSFLATNIPFLEWTSFYRRLDARAPHVYLLVVEVADRGSEL